MKKDNELTIDLTFSEEQWKNVKKEEVKKIVKQGVEKCIVLLLAKADSINDIMECDNFKSDFDKLISEF